MNRAAIKGRSLWDDSLRRLLANKAAMAGFVVLGILTLIALIGPLVWPHPYATQYQDKLHIGPTLENMHWLGTDIYGRDMVARVMTGLQISLAVGLIATLVSLAIGVTWGHRRLRRRAHRPVHDAHRRRALPFPSSSSSSSSLSCSAARSS